MSVNFSGFDDLEKQLKRMAEGAEELGNASFIPLDELFTPTFMKNCSSFSSFDEFLSAGNFNADTQEEFDAIPDDELDKHVSSVTSFSTWEDMLDEATNQYISRKLGL